MNDFFLAVLHREPVMNHEFLPYLFPDKPVDLLRTLHVDPPTRPKERPSYSAAWTPAKNTLLLQDVLEEHYTIDCRQATVQHGIILSLESLSLTMW